MMGREMERDGHSRRLTRLSRMYYVIKRGSPHICLWICCNEHDVTHKFSAIRGIKFVYVETVKEVLEEVFRGHSVVEQWKTTL